MFYYFHRLLFKLHFFRYCNVTFTKRIRNKKFRIPVIKETGYLNLLGKENWMDNLLADLFNVTNGMFVDVGMNAGQTLLKVSSLDDKRKYVGFEPNPFCFYYCYKLIETNKLKECNIYPVGLFNETSILTLHMDKEYAAGASVLEDFRKNKGRYSIKLNVPVFKGDDILQAKENGEKSIIKIDVEGAELEAIKGLYNTISTHQPFIILEILPVYSLDSENGQYRYQRQQEMLSILDSLGYEMYRINEKEEMLNRLNEVEVHGSMQLTNYLFIPQQKYLLLEKFRHYKIS